MNNSELDQVLRSAGVPDRSQQDWDQFARRVLTRVQWAKARSEAEAGHARTEPHAPRFHLRFAAVGLALVAVGLAIGFAFGLHHGRQLSISDSELAAARKYFQEVEALFPNQVKAIILDRQGPHLVLADRPDMPASLPLCLKISGTDDARIYITFSGQQVLVNGETCEVLQDHQGDVLLVGQQEVWSSAQGQPTDARYRVSARSLAKL